MRFYVDNPKIEITPKIITDTQFETIDIKAGLKEIVKSIQKLDSKDKKKLLTLESIAKLQKWIINKEGKLNISKLELVTTMLNQNKLHPYAKHFFNNPKESNYIIPCQSIIGEFKSVSQRSVIKKTVISILENLKIRKITPEFIHLVNSCNQSILLAFPNQNLNQSKFIDNRDFQNFKKNYITYLVSQYPKYPSPQEDLNIICLIESLSNQKSDIEHFLKLSKSSVKELTPRLMMILRQIDNF